MKHALPAAILLGLVLVAAARSSVVLAADYEFAVERKDGRQPLHETTAMKVGPAAAPWIPSFIKLLRSRRPPTLHPITIALFRGEANERYLAVSWGRYGTRASSIEFHKVIEGPDDRRQIRFMRALSDWSVRLVHPSGEVLFPGEPTVAVVSTNRGGSNVGGEEFRLIQMELNTVDITPDWAGRVVDVADIDGDGRDEVVVMDSAWAHYFDGRGAAGPHLPVVLDRVNGRFVPTCQKYAAIYHRWIDRDLRYANKSAEPAVYRAEAFAEAYLATIQIAALDQAPDLYRRLIDVVKSHRSGMPPGLDVDLIRRDYRPLLVMAPRFAKFGCVVGATGRRSVEEMVRFRLDQDGRRRLKAASEAP
jgi:hypothetical protein